MLQINLPGFGGGGLTDADIQSIIAYDKVTFSNTEIAPLDPSKVTLVRADFYESTFDTGGDYWIWDTTLTAADFLLDPLQGVTIESTFPGAPAGGWRRVYGGPVSVRFWGTRYVANYDNGPRINAALSYLKQRHELPQGGWYSPLDFNDRIWDVREPLNLTDLTNPYFTIQNGGVYIKHSGLGLDYSGTVRPRAINFTIIGHITLMPSVGIWLSRRDNGSGGFPAAAEGDFINCKALGYYDKAALINMASEVVDYGFLVVENKNPAVDAYAAMFVSTMQSIINKTGSAVTSTFVTVPDETTGNHSNIGHMFSRLDVRRPFAKPSVTSITNSSTPLVTVSSIGSLVNGDFVHFTNVVGMTELNGNSYEISNVIGNTFNLVGVDTTLFGTFLSGEAKTRTGPGIYIQGVTDFISASGYGLVAGSPMVEVECDIAPPVIGVNISMDVENDPPSLVDFLCTTTETISGFKFHNTNKNQFITDAPWRIIGGGDVNIDGGEFIIDSMAGGVPPNGEFSPAGDFALNSVKRKVPFTAAATAATDFRVLPKGGSLYVSETDIETHYGGQYRYGANFDAIELEPGTDVRFTEGFRATDEAYMFFDRSGNQERQVQLVTTATTGQLTNIAHAINTTGKTLGKIVVNSGSGRIVYATGSAAGDPWHDGNNILRHTPA